MKQKRKYVIPEVNTTEIEIKCNILADSSSKDPGASGAIGGGSGSGSGGSPPPPGGQDGGITGGDGDGLAKDHNFNAWESWDEY